MHGYAIWKIISKRRNVTLANIYYHLKRLEAAGLIARESFKERKVYFITSKGIAFLRNLKSKLNVLSEDLNKVV
ncbi:MAG TPA: PadR family transcriptional regulator, partial [Thermoproteales archaeon]|nr:PadR family transcriptional regulator [Thermoproteales archaeon]